MSSRPECSEDCLESFGLPIPDDILRNACYRSAKRGHLECLRFAHENGSNWGGVIVTNMSSAGGYLDCLRYAHENGCPWNKITCENASWGGHLDCLRYAHEHGCPWDRNTTENASGEGHLECLRYAHEHGCSWDEGTCAVASWSGHLDCLRYAHEHGCPWNERTCELATYKDQLECLRYAHEHGCSWDQSACVRACESGSLECLRYLLENRCPTPDFMTIPINNTLIPYLHHRGIVLPRDRLRAHIRSHVSKAKVLIRCLGVLLRSYREACERVYSPDGVGYREAELSFREVAFRPCSPIGDPSDYDPSPRDRNRTPFHVSSSPIG